MKKKILIIYAHPEPTSLTRQLVQVTVDTLENQGHEVIHSDLYGMQWKAVYDEADFPVRSNPDRFHSLWNQRMLTPQDNRQKTLPKNKQSC